MSDNGNSELSNRFDVLYNNITSSQAPGLDEYEKSVFFNKAQLEVVKNHINPKGNKYGEGIDSSSKRQLEFANLVKDAKLLKPANQNETNSVEFCHNGYRFEFGNITFDDMLSIINEHVVVGGRSIPVVPLNHMEYDTLMSRPYQRPPRSQAWRLLVNGHVEVVLGVDGVPSEYHIRYVNIPNEVDLADTESADAACTLPAFLVDEILQRAVELAKAAYVGDMNQQQIIQNLGERSE